VITAQQESPENATSVEKAELYEKYRLPYAHEAVDDLLDLLEGNIVVVDIGAGSGQLARLFADRCEKAYLVEPDPAMRYVASASLANFTSVEICPSSAEDTGLASNSIDLIVIGNAFHRFRPEACVELRRILKIHVWIALFACSFNNNAFSEMLSSKLGKLKDVSDKIEKTWYRTPVE
jgi:SAM-dependent methyltransferase